VTLHHCLSRNESASTVPASASRVNTYDILAGMHPQPDDSPYLNKIQLFLVIVAHILETKKIMSGTVLFGEILTKQSYLTVKVSMMKAQ
jgi:hypothetical protein